MNITEEMMDDLKSQVTESDMEKMTRDFKLLKEISETIHDDDDLYKFILLFSTTFIMKTGTDIEHFIKDIRRGHEAIIQIGNLEIKGH